MPPSRIEPIIKQIRKSALRRDGVDMTDGQLLERFVGNRDETAFEALVRRHGPMVCGVCHRLLHSQHDAEDAFQATFLVLARKAASIVPRELVGNWLYGVAHTTAVRARAVAAKLRARERQVIDMPEPTPDEKPIGDLYDRLDRELKCLPHHFRSAIVLCDLEGRTRAEVARQLKIPEGTLSSRLTTGRRLLAKRLSRQSLAISVGAITAAMSQAAALGMPAGGISGVDITSDRVDRGR